MKKKSEDDSEMALLAMLCKALDEFFVMKEEDVEVAARVLCYLRSRYSDFFDESESLDPC